MTITKETAYKLYDLDKKIVECTRQLGTLLEKREETIMADLNNMDEIRNFVRVVYISTDDMISKEELEDQVSATMEQIKAGDWTAIYSEVSNALIEYEFAREFWIGMLDKLVGFQRYGVQ